MPVARVYIAGAAQYRERPRTALETARTFTKRALELDPMLAEGHLSLADVRRMLEWDWQGADAAYQQANALKPSQENSHRGYGTMLVALGRFREGISELERACELDPLCLVVGTSAAWVYYLAGDTLGALTHCRRTTDIDPEYLPAWRVMGLAYLRAGKTGEAIRVLDAAFGRSRHDPIFVAALVHARAAAGDHAAAGELGGELDRMRHNRYVPPYHASLAYVGLNNHDAAFRALEQAVVDCDPALVNLAVEPRFEPLHADSRYGRLLALLGLPSKGT